MKRLLDLGIRVQFCNEAGKLCSKLSPSLSLKLPLFLSLFLLLPRWVLQIVFQPQSSTRLLKSCASNLLTWLNANFYMNYDCLSSLHALYLHHHHHCHDDHHGEYFCLWELPTGDCKWTFCCVLLLIYCLEIFFGFTCAQDSSAKGFPYPSSFSFSFSGKLWNSGTRPACSRIYIKNYLLHLLFQVLLTHSHTLPAKSQNFLIALFVSTAAFSVVVSFVFVLSFERFFFSLRWRHVRAFIFP